MKIILETSDIEFLLTINNGCLLIPEWNGGVATLNKTEDGVYYMVRWQEVRWQEYEPCTEFVDVDTLVNVILSDGVVLYIEDYAKLYSYKYLIIGVL